MVSGEFCLHWGLKFSLLHPSCVCRSWFDLAKGFLPRPFRPPVSLASHSNGRISSRKRKWDHDPVLSTGYLQDALSRLRDQREMFKNVRFHETRMPVAPPVSNVRKTMERSRDPPRKKPRYSRQPMPRSDNKGKGKAPDEGHIWNSAPKNLGEISVPFSQMSHSGVPPSSVWDPWHPLPFNATPHSKVPSATISEPRYLLPSNATSVRSTRTAPSTFAPSSDFEPGHARHYWDHRTAEPTPRILPPIADTQLNQMNVEFGCGKCGCYIGPVRNARYSGFKRSAQAGASGVNRAVLRAKHLSCRMGSLPSSRCARCDLAAGDMEFL